MKKGWVWFSAMMALMLLPGMTCDTVAYRRVSENTAIDFPRESLLINDSIKTVFSVVNPAFKLSKHKHLILKFTLRNESAEIQRLTQLKIQGGTESINKEVVIHEPLSIQLTHGVGEIVMQPIIEQVRNRKFLKLPALVMGQVFADSASLLFHKAKRSPLEQ